MKKRRNIVIVTCILTMAGLTACSSAGQGQPIDGTIPPQTAEETAPLLYEEDAAPEDIPDIGRE